MAELGREIEGVFRDVLMVSRNGKIPNVFSSRTRASVDMSPLHLGHWRHRIDGHLVVVPDTLLFSLQRHGAQDRRLEHQDQWQLDLELVLIRTASRVASSECPPSSKK